MTNLDVLKEKLLRDGHLSQNDIKELSQEELMELLLYLDENSEYSRDDSHIQF